MSAKNQRLYLLIGWSICGLGALYYAYEYFLRISPSVMAHELQTHFGLSATGFGFLSAFYYYAYVPMQLPVGILMDRFGPRNLLTLACLICVLGTLLFTNTTLFSVAATGRFMVGFGSAFAFVGVLKLATIWLPGDRLALVAGLATALGTIGAMIGDRLLGGMVANMGWQRTNNLTAIVGVGLAVALWLYLHDKKTHLGETGTVSSFRQSMIDLRIIARNRQIWINGLYGCLVYLPTTVFAELWGISYLQHAHGLTEFEAHKANSFLFLGFTIGAPLMGFISDKLRQRRLPMLLGAGSAACVMMTILYWPGLGVTSLNWLLFILGLLYSAQAIVFAVGRELSPKEAAGTAIAMTNMIVMIGAMLLQPLVGRLLDWSFSMRQAVVLGHEQYGDKLAHLYTADDYQFALSIIPIGILIAAILTFCLKETYAHSDENPGG